MSNSVISAILLLIIGILLVFILYRMDTYREKELNWIVDNKLREKQFNDEFSYISNADTITATDYSQSTYGTYDDDSIDYSEIHSNSDRSYD